MGLNFFTYATSVDFTVPAANSDTFHYRLDLTGLRGQATGLIGGQLIIRDAAGDSIATVPMVPDVRGSVLSVYGLFGIALLVLTVLALIDAAFGIATHRLSANRWQRGLRLLAPGIGVGLVLTFSASVARLWVPDGGRWLLIGGLTAAACFAIGYFAPVPGDEGADADLDADLDADDLSEHVDTDEFAGDEGADADLDADDLSEHARYRRVRAMTTIEDRIRAALPNFDIGGQIGRGGCGVVLSGTHRQLRRQVAIKQIPPQFAESAAVRRRFLVEAQLIASIEHPHVVPVYDYVEDGDLCLLVMDTPGGTVATRFTTTGFDAASAIAVTLACAAGLEAAHRHGVLHRDIKPANLLFSANGAVKLTDFGIAKIVGGNDTLVTRAGEIVGTPSYIAPEQVRGQELTPATDVYALATMLYQLLSGVLPFPPGDHGMAVLFMHAFEQPKPLTEVAPTVPEPIADVVMRGLATDPTERFDSAESFGIALAEPAAGTWGSDWLTPVGIPVIGADTIVNAATRSEHPSRPTEPQDPNRMRVRPAEALPRPRIELADVGRKDVAPVQQVVKFPSPWVPVAVAAVLAVLAVAVALVGLGAPPFSYLSDRRFVLRIRPKVSNERPCLRLALLCLSSCCLLRVAASPPADANRLSSCDGLSAQFLFFGRKAASGRLMEPVHVRV